MPTWLPTWVVVLLAFWPFGAAFVVAAVAWCVEDRRDQSWDAQQINGNTLPGNLSEGRTR